MTRQPWWKLLCIVLLISMLVVGLLMPVPAKPNIKESIRNYFFHPPLWVAMMTFFTTSVVYSIKYLRTGKLAFDFIAKEYAATGLFFGLLGLSTGMFWAKYTWGAYWTGDPKLTGTVIGLLIYCAYIILRGSLTDLDKRAKTSSVYNIFAYVMLFPTLFIIPRMMESLHPGSSGNPAINPKDVSIPMFVIFWTMAVPGYILLGLWLTSLKIRINNIRERDIL
ncbi:MAG TPA: cytochrome c biogenesis protein [Agriterribacter sp.]|nr:cytochrome c biogenesis protein [Agriterribacter sp.]